MNAKTLLVLGLASAALLGAAFVVASQREGAYTPARENGKKLFPELAKDVNSVVELTVRSKDSTVAVKRDGERWGMADKGGYPVDFDKVKQLVVAISEFEILSEMTRNPEHFKKLGVQDPTAEESESKQVTLKNASGAVLADVIIGSAKTTQGFGGKPSLFVRPVSGDQPYQVTGQVNLFGDASSWMKRDICKIESNRVAQVVIEHPDGAKLAIAKSAPEDKDFAVQDLPAGEELMWSGAANPIGGALQYLSLEDVKPADQITLENPTTAEFTTFDGVRLTVQSAEMDGKTWIRLAAAFDESLRSEQAGPPAPPAAEGAEGAEAPPPAPASTLKPVEDVRKEVEELNAQFSRWVYAVPGYNGANFRKRVTDLLKKKPEEGEGDEAFDGSVLDLPVTDDGDEPPAGEPIDDGHEGHDHDGHDHDGDGHDDHAPAAPQKPAGDGGR